ncbi:GNAT family N-acetyltransferase [Marinomonas ostreistagni]|uniref:GNAT family N-acetyltransferase n=1 Tax=Marinomonas ostreistagni TaxID=359209 RepID=UPI00194DF7E4|nr:GNAT family N-acetyltransferase [Marinomonas ostreistagni]MBM6552283.1 GNAT family N-acetyltransferase [Marinomonas ostreistagni]
MPPIIQPIAVEPLWFPLVKKFYQAYYPSGKPNKAEPMWAIKDGATIIAAVRLKPFADCQLLTALVTHPQARGQGYARQLVQHLQPQLTAQPSFCMNHRDLKHFYEQCGFSEVSADQLSNLPDDITGRFQRYCLKQPNLILMQFNQS